MPCAGGVALCPLPRNPAILRRALTTGAAANWRSGLLIKWSGIPLAVGIALYLPSTPGPRRCLRKPTPDHVGMWAHSVERARLASLAALISLLVACGKESM